MRQMAAFAACGEGCVFEGPGPFLWHPERMRLGRTIRIRPKARLQVNPDPEGKRTPWLDLGDGVVIGAGCQLSASAGISVGPGTRLGDEVLILDNSHSYEDPETPIPQQPVLIGGPIRIGADVYIGRGAVILAGVTVGDGAVILDRAVVLNDVPAGEWVIGSPAKPGGRLGGGRDVIHLRRKTLSLAGGNIIASSITEKRRLRVFRRNV